MAVAAERQRAKRDHVFGHAIEVFAAQGFRRADVQLIADNAVVGKGTVAVGLGSGAESRAPMGTAIVGGMITSTLLTLVVIPVMYSVMDDLAVWFKGRVRRSAVATGSPPHVVELEAAPPKAEQRQTDEIYA